ncbi:MMPL family transporter [Frankia sp. AgB1.9]|uniref:MMPL family transporter n=1 Tax=unclassified Frankia TaxID=2632575 RepID=UPI00193354F3|nr:MULTISPECIES: MMPL family transporter [unclassified Frankia]MBL7489437.1 MMPL family transporter [Frankia sp. AgW1.1]MBL7550628.1 MMPL family transporter [Frankia sp. AgB1.9]MBL7620997.1 MMPL family transporter [Frankia sp. AgB1.8]
MTRYLDHLGRFAFRRGWLVLAAWLGLLLLTALGALTLSGSTSDAFNLPGTQSQRAQNLLQDRFPGIRVDGAIARIVFSAPAGEQLTAPRWKEAVSTVVARLTASPEVVTVTSPYDGALSADGRVGLVQVAYAVPAASMSDAARGTLSGAIAAGRATGLTVEAGGDATSHSSGQHATELIGLAVAAVVLVVAVGSLVLAGLPLLVAFVGVGISLTAVATATGFIHLSSQTPTLALMLGLAVAIDYSLFVITRYRAELDQGLDGEEAAGRAVATAGSAVVFAGLTVAIALAGLVVVNIPFLADMGIAASLAVLLAVAAALTLLPALLGLTRRRVGPRGVRAGRDHVTAPTLGRRWVGLVTRRPKTVLVAAVLSLAALALPALGLRLALPDDGTAAPDTSARKAYDLLAANFGAGFNGPLTVVIDGRPAGSGAIADPGAAATTVSAEIQRLRDVASVRPARVNTAGDTAVFSVVPKSGPSSRQTTGLVRSIRRLPSPDGAQISVTGPTALNVDITDSLDRVLMPYLLLVVGLAVVLLAVVFRSVLVPLTAVVGFLLTLVASLGVVVAVFQWGWAGQVFGIEGQTGPIMSLLPVLVVGLLFGLAMDYQVFLVARMREDHTRGARPTQAVVSGFERSARVVTAAAFIMISVFGGFLLAPTALIKQLGLALAVGVAVDAFVVRMTVVPAVMTLLGRATWWLPGWLARVLPDLDVEGARVGDQHSRDEDADLMAAPTSPAADAPGRLGGSGSAD